MNPPTQAPQTMSSPDGNIPLPAPLKQNIKDGMVALTMAAWCFVRAWAHLLFGEADYFNAPPASPVELLALAVNLLGVGLVIFLGIRVWRRFQTGIAPLGLDLLFLLLLVFPADFVRVQVLHRTHVPFALLLRHPAEMLCLAAIAVVLVWQHRQAVRVLAMVIVVTFPMVLFIFAKISLVSLNLMTLSQCPSAAPPPALLHVPDNQPRVVWIIFDETDYRLSFEKRPANVRLPEFDRLRQESLDPNHAYPPSDSTVLSMPVLIAGEHFLAARMNGCDLELTLPDGATAAWSTLPSAFSRARELGVNTALIGWYHPYARVLGGSLNYCSWYPFPFYEPARSTTFSGAVEQQFYSLLEPFSVRRNYILGCNNSLAAAAEAVANPAYGLILLHLPPPHGPWVYLPERNEFTCLASAAPAGYFDNLMLADHELGVVRGAMTTAGLWDKSWVILSADHSWRDSKSYDGKRDYRVPFLVKSPGMGKSMPYSHQFNTVLTQDLILAILRGEVTNQAGAAAFLNRGTPEMPILQSQPMSSQ